MFYTPEDGHGLSHNPFSAIVSPRPIGWISSRDADGHDNLAPYSFFNAIAYTPPQVMFASTASKPDRGDTKDTVGNIRETGVFCVNIVGKSLANAMNMSSGGYARTVDEFSHGKIARAECSTIACARVADAPAALECRLTDIIPLKGRSNFMVLGEVIGVHMRDDCLVDGRFDVTKYTPIARLGYRDFTAVDQLFSMERPDD